jgi:hypothetical protein
LPEGGRCEPVYIDYGSLRLRVALDGAAVARAEAGRLKQDLEAAARGTAAVQSLIEVVPSPARADWVVRLKGNEVTLLRRQQSATRAGSPPPDSPFGSHGVDDRLSSWLEENLRKVARVEVLKRLAAAPAGALAGSDEGVRIDLDMVRLRDPDDREGQVLRPDKGLELLDGDVVAFRVTNRSRAANVYITLLFLDSDYGITSLYPKDGDSAKPLSPDKAFQIRLQVGAGKVPDLDHVLAIALEAGPQPVDFSCLEQEDIRDAPPAMRTPLGRLFQNALYGRGSTRGLDRKVLDNHALRLCSWRTLPGKGGAGRK